MIIETLSTENSSVCLDFIQTDLLYILFDSSYLNETVLRILSIKIMQIFRLRL